MESVFLKVLNNSMAATFLVLAVLIVRALFKKAPGSARCALWFVVGLRLCLPVNIQSVFSLVPSAQTVSPEIVYAREPAIASGIGAVDRAVNPVIAQTFAPTPHASANPLQIWLFIAAWVWVIGVGLMLLYSAVSYVRLHAALARSVPLRDNIRISERAPSPFMLGIVRPRLYLPTGLEEEVRELAIAHEWAHVERLDHVTRPLGFLLLAVYWFNPLLWLSFVLFCRDMERACDEKVLQSLGPEKKKAYSRALLACSAPRRSLAACPLAFGETGVKGRIENILRYKKAPRWALAVSVVLCAMLALGFLTNPVVRDPEAVYAPVLDLYAAAASEGWTGEQLSAAGIDLRLRQRGRGSYTREILDLNKLSYRIEDLDGDGVPELLLNRESFGQDGPGLLSLYTVKDGRAVQVPLSGAWTEVCPDGQIVEYAALQEDGYYVFFGKTALENGVLVMTEGVMAHRTDEETRANTFVLYDRFYQVTGSRFDISTAQSLSEDEAWQLVAERYCGPFASAPYTPLADWKK